MNQTLCGYVKRPAKPSNTTQQLGDFPIGQAALAEPDHMPPTLLFGCSRQLAHVHVPHARELGSLVNQITTMRAASIIEAWASMKSFRPKDGGDEPPGPGRNVERDFRGERRSDKTHASTTDPDARLRASSC